MMNTYLMNVNWCKNKNPTVKRSGVFLLNAVGNFLKHSRYFFKRSRFGFLNAVGVLVLVGKLAFWIP